jgi:hypothetical protein
MTGDGIRTHDFKNLCGGDDGPRSRARSRQLECSYTVAGFVIFIIASMAWMADGWLESKASLVIQNVILLLINALGVWRWLPKAEKEVRKSVTLVAKPVATQQGLIDSDRRFGTFRHGDRYE